MVGEEWMGMGRRGQKTIREMETARMLYGERKGFHMLYQCVGLCDGDEVDLILWGRFRGSC